jgi:RNA ligase (TIGR02306 family)
MTCEIKKSTHKVEIVPVTLQKHPNADALSIVPVFGYSYVARTADWQGVTKGAYLPPDSVVDVTRPEFSFLAEQAKGDGKVRIKAKKLRGVVSFGLMVPVPDDTPLGEDWAERLGVEHYEPPLPGEQKKGVFMGGEVASPPDVFTVKYDVDAFRRYHRLFQPGEPVIVTEKLDGANSRYVYMDGKMHCGSRTEWKKQFPDYSHLTVESLVEKGMTPEKAKEALDRVHAKPQRKNLWWEVLERTPALEKFCRDNPGVVVYGEVYGNVNCIKYGLPDVNRFAAFDILKDGRWLQAEMARTLAADIPWVPTLTPFFVTGGTLQTPGIPYDFDRICEMAEGQSLVFDSKPGVLREGIVVKPLYERWDEHVGRVCFKVVSAAFLERYR